MKLIIGFRNLGGGSDLYIFRGGGAGGVYILPPWIILGDKALILYVNFLRFFCEFHYGLVLRLSYDLYIPVR